MVDINLMGEEENREEQQPEENLAQTVNLDLGDTAEEEKVESFPREPLPGSYPRERMGSPYTRPPSMSAPPGSSRNKAYLLVAALILAALVAVYLMIPRAEKPKPDVGELSGIDSTAGSEMATGTETAPQMPSATGTSGTTPETTMPETTQPMKTTPVEPPTSTMRETENLPPAMRSMSSSTRIGAYTIGALGQAFSGDNDFTLISYSGNNNSFFVQFLASSSAAVSEITQAMQRNASPEELRTVSKLPVGDGSAMNNVLVLGRVSERAAMMGPQGGQRRMSFTEFSTWLKKLGSDHGLRLKMFEVSKAYASDGSSRTPVQANFAGEKASVFEFLKNLAEAGPNISMSKIIVSPSDRKSQSSAKLDVVLLFDFVE